MKKYMKLLMVALFASLSFAMVSCGDDDDEPGAPGSGVGGGSEHGQYYFLFNGKKFYYGCDYTMEGFEWLGTMKGLGASFDLDASTKECFLLFTGYDKPLTYKEYLAGSADLEELGVKEYVDVAISLKNLNVHTAKKGDVIPFEHRFNSSGDAYNYLWYENFNNPQTVLYTWKNESVGTVKFVSYIEDEDGDGYLTLEFVNVVMSMDSDHDYSDYTKPNQAAISGTITFRAGL